MPFSSAKSEIILVVMEVHSLYIVLASAMGLQLLSSVGSPFLCKSIMLLCFQAVGVMPVVHMCWNSLKKQVCALSGSILISSLGMLSGPGVLLLERFRRAVSKRTLVSFLERSVP